MTTTDAHVNVLVDCDRSPGAAAHERVVSYRDEATGLHAIIAIHNTQLGPALGGTRFYPYPNEAEALNDVLRLSEGMTYKAAAAGLPLGGGKAVIIGDPATDKSPRLLEAYGRFVESLSGAYFTAADIGTTAEDLDVIAGATRYVAGSNGGSGDSGFSTASGVLNAMKAAALHRWGAEGLRGMRVGVEGVGKVGAHLVGLLLNEGASVTVSDHSKAAISRLLDQHPVTVRYDVLNAPVDIYAPCALGATLTDSSVYAVRARIVCGAANNQLLDASVASLLHDRGITWVPDYVANAGGLIQVGGEILGRSGAEVGHHISHIAATVSEILRRSEENSSPPSKAAAEIVAERLGSATRGVHS